MRPYTSNGILWIVSSLFAIAFSFLAFLSLAILPTDPIDSTYRSVTVPPCHTVRSCADLSTLCEYAHCTPIQCTSIHYDTAAHVPPTHTPRQRCANPHSERAFSELRVAANATGGAADPGPGLSKGRIPQISKGRDPKRAKSPHQGR
jgi:hypothetical protein